LSRLGLVFFLFVVDVTLSGLLVLLRSFGHMDLPLLVLDNAALEPSPSLRSLA
jgi:hypothetical protein